MILITYLTY